MSHPDLDLGDALSEVADAGPLVHSITNDVTVNDVAQTVLHWGGLPVMTDDEREVADMVAGAAAVLFNMGTASESLESTMLTTGEAANERNVPVVLDPVGVGATPTRDRLAERLATELDLTAIKGNHGEITALAGADAEVRGVESVGEYADIAETALACARQFDAVVVASDETDIVAAPDAVYELEVGHPMMGSFVGSGCMLGATVATMAGAIEDVDRAALVGTAAFGLAGEAAADGAFGEYHGPASYQTAFRDAVAGLDGSEVADPADRVERILGVE